MGDPDSGGLGLSEYNMGEYALDVPVDGCDATSDESTPGRGDGNAAIRNPARGTGRLLNGEIFMRLERCRHSFIVFLGLILVAAVGCVRPQPFTVVLLPDTQLYSQEHPDTYVAQMKWIKSNAAKDNIRFVIHLGDIVNRHGIEKQWQNADNAHRILDGVVPYSMVPGNHDFEHRGKQFTRETPLYTKYFPPSRFENHPWYGGHMGRTNANNFCFFEGGGKKFMVVSLEVWPSDQAIEWADGVVGSHKDREVIIATHSYLDRGGRSRQKRDEVNSNSGQDLWNKLVSKHENIFMVVCGHVSGWRHQTSTNDVGRNVHEIMFDYQSLPNGGNGWLVPMRFVPNENQIEVKPYSPTLNQYATSPEQVFALDYDMTRKPVRKPVVRTAMLGEPVGIR